jgi:ATP-binding protein involved in chromosome partitioning
MLEDRVTTALRRVVLGPEGPDVVEAGLVHDVVATGDAVRVLLDLDRIPDGDTDPLISVLKPIVEEVAGVGRVVVKPRPRRVSKGGIPGIGAVLGVHSGKGGVGKSTLCANLAVAMAADGLRVGILDGDVYGPSIPTLLGLSGRVEESDGRIRPREAHGVKVMSLALLMPPEKALIWRGSLVAEGFGQLIRDVGWGRLDVLLIDLPPGTSDVHLAAAQDAGLNAVVTVTAPGILSVQDVRRGMEMFADMAVPCLGIVENMAMVVCRRCGQQSTPFGSGGGQDIADLTGLPLLASIPLVPALAEACDAGVPIIVAEPHSAPAAAIRKLAADLVPVLTVREGVQ